MAKTDCFIGYIGFLNYPQMKIFLQKFIAGFYTGLLCSETLRIRSCIEFFLFSNFLKKIKFSLKFPEAFCIFELIGVRNFLSRKKKIYRAPQDLYPAKRPRIEFCIESV